MIKETKNTPEFDFSRLLLQWNTKSNTRQMPWKGEKDPYKIWLSEIILQQTRVEQGLSYYSRFIKVFPDINKLARASDEKVFKYWEGLGYYSRCRNLIVAARYVSRDLKGVFPSEYEEIIKLKGVGSYTASAIASFAYNLPYAVVDGNVFRVLARIFGIKKPIDSTEGKKYFSALARELLDEAQPGLYNQAIMDFGATVCKPVSPLCSKCPFQSNCFAFHKEKITVLPVKLKKAPVRKRWFYYFVLQADNRIAVQQRTDKDIWQGLYEFPVIEASEETSIERILKQAEKKGWISKSTFVPAKKIEKYSQKLSHQLVTGIFIKIDTQQFPVANWRWLTPAERKKVAFPVIINRFLKSGHLSK